MMKNIAWTLVSIAVTITSSTAFSAQLMQTMSFGPSTPNFVAGPFDFDQFDPALGTLNFVEIKLQLDVEGGSLIVDNDGAEGGTLTGVEIGAEGTLVSPDVNLLDIGFSALGANVIAATMADFTLDGNVGDGLNDFDSSAPDGGILNGLSQTASDSGQLNTTFWPQVTGTGTYAISAEVDQVNNFGTGIGGVEGAFTAVEAKGNVMVTYDYEPVPEPVFGLMLCPAFLALGCMLRRRR